MSKIQIAETLQLSRDEMAAMQGYAGGAMLESGYADFKGTQFQKDAYQFVEGALEVVSPRLIEPLKSSTYQEHITPSFLEGFVDAESVTSIDYHQEGGNDSGFIDNLTNKLKTVQGSLERHTNPVHSWGRSAEVSYLDLAKEKSVSRKVTHLVDVVSKAVWMSWDRAKEQAVYTGYTSLGTTGLVNDDANITSATADADGTGSSTNFSAKNGSQISDEIQTMISDVWAACGYSKEIFPDMTLLLPPAVFSYLQGTKYDTSSGDATTILEFIKQKNLAVANGGSLTISPCQQCIGVGSGSTDRAVLYVNNKESVTIPILELRKVNTVGHALMIETAYMGQLGEVRFNRTQPVTYLDGV